VQLVTPSESTVEDLCVDAASEPAQLIVTTYGYSGR
jgi:hypothetical protein